MKVVYSVQYNWKVCRKQNQELWESSFTHIDIIEQTRDYSQRENLDIPTRIWPHGKRVRTIER